MTTLAVLVIFAVGYGFGILTICLLVASSRNEQTEPRPSWRTLHLVVPGEGPRENLANALQCLTVYPFAESREERLALVSRAADRITAAVEQLKHKEQSA